MDCIKAIVFCVDDVIVSLVFIGVVVAVMFVCKQKVAEMSRPVS